MLACMAFILALGAQAAFAATTLTISNVGNNQNGSMGTIKPGMPASGDLYYLSGVTTENATIKLTLTAAGGNVTVSPDIFGNGTNAPSGSTIAVTGGNTINDAASSVATITIPMSSVATLKRIMIPTNDSNVVASLDITPVPVTPYITSGDVSFYTTDTTTDVKTVKVMPSPDVTVSAPKIADVATGAVITDGAFVFGDATDGIKLGFSGTDVTLTPGTNSAGVVNSRDLAIRSADAVTYKEDSTTFTAVPVAGVSPTANLSAPFKVSVIAQELAFSPTAQSFQVNQAVSGTGKDVSVTLAGSTVQALRIRDINTVSMDIGNGLQVSAASASKLAFSGQPTSADTVTLRVLAYGANPPTAASLLTSKDFTITITGQGSEGLGTALGTLNGKLGGNVQVAAITSLPPATANAIVTEGVTNPVPITNLPANAFTAKQSPSKSLGSGRSALRPSFAVSVPVGTGSNTTGNVLALTVSMDLRSIANPDLTNWSSLNSDTARSLLLTAANVSFVYEYAGTRASAALIGADGLLTWSEAAAEGIVQYNNSGLQLHYVAIDGTTNPARAGGMLIVPDGVKDNVVNDPLWLTRYTSTPGTVPPSSISLDPSSVIVGATGFVTVEVDYYPLNTTERDVTWSVANSAIASIVPSATGDYCTIFGVTPGTTTVTAVSKAAGTVRATLPVTVTTGDPNPGWTGSSSGGCNAGAFGLLFVLGAAAMVARKRG